jgi:hypothetical protein
MIKPKKQETKAERNLRKTLIEEMLRLATSALGLVAALAWNDLIKEFISEYIKPFVGEDSGLASMLIYALIVTILAVSVTYQLSRLTKKD